MYCKSMNISTIISMQSTSCDFKYSQPKLDRDVRNGKKMKIIYKQHKNIIKCI